MVNKKLIVVLFSLILALTFIMGVAMTMDDESMGEDQGQDTIIVKLTISSGALTKVEQAQSGDENTIAIRNGVLNLSDRQDITVIGSTSCILSVDLKGKITEVIIPKQVEELKRSCFNGCTGLTEVKFNEGAQLTKIGLSAFQNCTKLTSIKIPSSVTSIGNRVFQGCTALTTIEIPSSVTSIGTNVFQDCTKLTSIEIPSSVTLIQGSAFKNCTALTDVTISSSVKAILVSAFENCTSLRSIDIPPSVTQISSAAFKGCTQLQNVKLEDNLELIGLFNGAQVFGNVFEGCSSLKEITIPASVTKIADSTFLNCESLSSVNIPADSKLSYIGKATFRDCKSLSKINIPSSITQFNDELFYGCTQLSSLGFDDSHWAEITGFGTDWYNGTKLNPVFQSEISLDMLGERAIPQGTTFTCITVLDDNGNSFKVGAFDGLKTDKLVIKKISSIINGNSEQKPDTRATNLFGKLEVSELILGDTDTPSTLYIPQTYFMGNTGLKTVTINESIRDIRIAANAFNGCTSLETFNFACVKIIGDKSFENCAALELVSDTYIDLPLANNISPTAFDGTTFGLNLRYDIAKIYIKIEGLKDRLYVNGIKYQEEKYDLGNDSYLYLATDINRGGNMITKIEGSITSLSIKDEWNVVSIADGTVNFSVFGNSSLKNIDLGKNIKYVGSFAFDKSCIESATWSSEVSDLVIGFYAFGNCASLKTVGYGQNSIQNVTSVNSNAFEYCTSLLTIDLPANLYISDYLFRGCSNLTFNEQKTITISNGVGSYSFSGTLIEKVIIGGGDFTRAAYTFQDCESLEEVTIKDKTFDIPYGFFKNCIALEKIKYADQEDNAIYADSIGNDAFSLTGIKSIKITGSEGAIVTIGTSAFDGCSKLTDVTFSSFVKTGDLAFANCENLSDVCFTKGVTYTEYTKAINEGKTVGSKIGNDSFFNCVTLKSSGDADLKLTGVVSIGQRAFGGCISLTSVTMSDCLSSIEVNSFVGCSSLRTSSDSSNGLIIDNGGQMSVTGDFITKGQGTEIAMINPNVESIVIGKNVSTIVGIKELTFIQDIDTAISVLSSLKRITVEEGNEHFKSISGMLLTSEGVLVAVPCGMPSDGYLEISGVSTIGQYAFRDVPVKELVINGATEVRDWAFNDCSLLKALTIDSGDKDLVFHMGSVQGMVMDSILLKGQNITINSTPSYIGSLTVVCKNVSFNTSYALDTAENPMLKTVTISADKQITWYGSILKNSTILETLTLASENIQLQDGFIVKRSSTGLRANILIDQLQYNESLIVGDIEVHVSDAMSQSWSGHNSGLVYYDSRYGVLTAFEGTKVYVLSNIGKIQDITNGKFTVSTDDLYIAGDLLVRIINDDGTREELKFADGGYSIPGYVAGTVYLIEIDELEDGSDASKWHQISFVSKTSGNDSEIDIPSIYVYDGHSILKSALPTPEYPGFAFDGWYIDKDRTMKYKSDANSGQIDKDTILYAKWTSLGNYLDVDDTAGTFYILNDDGSLGNKYTGQTFESSGTVKLKFVPDIGYTLIGMSLTNLNENVVKEDLTIEVSSLTGYACITPIVKYFSSSTDLEYVVQRDTPKPTDNIVLAWRFSGIVSQVGMSWSGMPSVPLIVDDCVYIQVNDRIVCLDANTGATLNEINTGVSTTQFYHYLGYGGGYIVDYTSLKVYTCDLKEVCKVPNGIQYTVWDDGFFYGIVKDGERSTGVVWKMSPSQLDASGVMKNLWDGTTKDVNAFQYLFGTTSHAIVENGVMYYISVYSNSISVNALDLGTGTYSTKELTRLHNYYLDDGWLTYYNGYLYITAYTKGLFGTYTTQGNSIIGYMKVDGTTIEDPEYVTIRDKNGKEENRDSLTSAFVMQNGRGYLNITKSSQSSIGYFQVFDIGEDGKPVFVKEVDSVASHGSIVASTYNLTKDANGKLNGEVYIYIMNYSAGQVICIFTDVCKDGEWTLSDKGVKFSIDSGFGSQAVRVGTEGQLIFYNDSGFVYCYGTPEFAKKSWFFVDNGDTAEITTGDGVDGNSIKAFEKAVANMLGVRKATFDKTSGTVYALGTTYYVYYYGDDGQAYSVKFTDTFNLNKFSKIKTFYLNKDVSSANDLDPDAKWDYVNTKGEHVTVFVKDIVQNLRSYEPMTINIKPYVSYGYGGEYYTYYGQSGDVVELKLAELPTKDGYTFVGFTDGQTIYKYSVDDDKITAPSYVLKGYVVLEAVWYENNKTFNNVEVKIGDDLVVEDKDVTTLLVGFGGKVTVTLDGSGVYTISSSNNNILKIENGELIALKAGKAVMTVTVSSPIKDQTITVEVNVVEPTSSTVTLNKSSIGLYKGGNETLSASTDLDGVGVIWTSSDPKIAIVDSNGKVTAISEGIALITATAMDNSDAKSVCTVTVSLKKVTAISLSQISKTMKVGDSSALTATIAPTDAEDKRVTWASSNPSVVSVTTSGAIQALSKGTAIITATSVDGSYSASCTIKVEGTVSEITLDKTMIRLEVGSNSALKATTYPDEALSDNISWKSSDSSIASVSGGYVYAYKAGTATITVSYGDLTAVCTVVVSEKSVVKEDTKENTDGSKTVTKEEKTVSGDSTITTNTQETKDKNDKSMGSDVKISAESENKAVKTEATVKKDADGRVIESEVKTTVEAKIQTKDGKEIVSVSKEDILSAVDQIGAVKNTAGGSVEPVIVIDIGKASTAVSSSIDLSYESLIQIADGNDTTLRVNTSAGTLEMSSDVISTLSSDGSDLKLGIEKVSDEDVTKAMKEKVKDSTVFSLSATLGKTSIHQLGGKVSVTLPYALKGTVSSDVRIYHVDDDGTLKEMSCKYDAIGGTVSFVTDHFSYFVVSEESLIADEPADTGGDNELNTLLKIVIGLLAALIAVAIVSMILRIRGN